MASFDGKFVSSRQDWSTPQSLFDALDGEFGFTVDLAAHDLNHKCAIYLGQSQDAMKQEWLGTGWLNPPYGDSGYRMEKWVRKAQAESAQHGSTIVMLIPARTNTKWWHECCMSAAEIRFVCGRPKFGDAEHGLPQPLALVIFAPHEGDTKMLSFHLPAAAH